MRQTAGSLTEAALEKQQASMRSGMNCTAYDWLGAHPIADGQFTGTRFAVWAPNAQEVCIICDRTFWKHGGFYLNSSNEGVWTGTVPDMQAGEQYKYSIRTHAGNIIEKCDPYAFAAEHPPKTASIVSNLGGFTWHDQSWVEQRRRTNWYEKPLQIYEVHLGSWRRPKDGRRYLTYHELADQLVEYCQEMGFTHLQLMPITEYPFDGSWGYQSTGYFAPTSRHGSPHDFMAFVDKCHAGGIGVLIDWVPGHFPTDEHGLAMFDGTSLYEHSDPRQGFHPDWNTNIFNYGRFEVRNFLLSSARFWCDKYHVDGIRVDAVASMLYLDYSRTSGQWIPNRFGGRENLEAIQFLKDMNTMLHGEFPGILTIAEESTAWPGVSRPVYDGGLGFTMKWDMGWMNDTLRYLRRNPIHRRHHQNDLSFRSLYAFTENFVMPLSHDEVVHGKHSLLSQMPGDQWQMFANLRLLLGYQALLPGKSLLFMGAEIGQWTEWNHDAELDWALTGIDTHAGIKRFVKDINHLVIEHPALHERDCTHDGFAWIQADDAANSVYAFCRFAKDGKETLVVVLNMTPIPRDGYGVGVPLPGYYREILNSDAWMYGGTDVGSGGGVQSKPNPMHGRAQSIELTLPPLGISVFRHEPQAPAAMNGAKTTT
ncbi:1,4-alpha-glucan branching enzyme [Planctomicrobium piriforme]|uniref:1,4-alpha-glucan branching enzyme GlgB n=2 Tax=Planctomicrobium piriforme TaxID=1576369 RepID=A0A1I3GMB2_9PLAN|nr:1,4-alpha-glucan branching enzyme [Planctomicrobium piriforme]